MNGDRFRIHLKGNISMLLLDMGYIICAERIQRSWYYSGKENMSHIG